MKTMQVNGDGAIVHIRISPVGRIMIQTQLLLLKDSIIRKWNAPYFDVLFGLLVLLGSGIQDFNILI